MKRHVAGGFLVAGCMMLVAAGCAKEQMVKKDETIAPTSKAAPAAQKAVVKTEPVQQPQIKENTVQNVAKETSSQTQLQSALEKIYFDFDSARMSDAARTTLTKNAAALKKDSALKVRIEGNCDERGSAEYNLALGEKRAEAAKKYLVTMGIAAKRLSVISYGKEKPVDPGHDEAAWAKNRRDEFIVQ